MSEKDERTKEPTKDEMDRWIITAMSHMKMLLEENNAPWTATDERMFNAIRRLISSSKVSTKVVCLCGSTRFTETMLIESWELAKQGVIAIGWHALPDSYFDGKPRTHQADVEGVREIVDEVHKRKIDLADEIYVVNVGGYIGDSTKSEMRYAAKTGKPIYFHEPAYAKRNLIEAGVEVKE